MKRILVTGAGGAPATNFVRSLRLSGEPFHLIGVDSDKFAIQRAETDQKLLVPKAKAEDYIPVLNDIIAETGAEMVFAQPDVEIEVLSERREEVNARQLLPAKETVRILQDKWLSFQRWSAAGLRVPETMMINTPEDVDEAFRTLGPKLWLREINGAFGKGSFPTSNPGQAKAWIDYCGGWGRFSAAECLSPQSVTWQSIWWNGELVVAQSRLRLYWEFANRAPSGVTGITGTGVTVADPEIDEIALAAIFAVDKRPHGIFAVDMTYDRNGVPNPTEINIGRFFTTHLFFSKAGLNMPLIFVKLAFEEQLPELPRRINPLPEGLAWVRGMDVEPVLTTMAEIDRAEAALRERQARLRERRTDATAQPVESLPAQPDTLSVL